MPIKWTPGPGDEWGDNPNGGDYNFWRTHAGPGGQPQLGPPGGVSSASGASPAPGDNGGVNKPPPPDPTNIYTLGQGGDRANLFLGNYVPLQNYLYANSGRVLTGRAQDNAPGMQNLDNALYQQANVTTGPASGGGGSSGGGGTSGTGGTSNGGDSTGGTGSSGGPPQGGGGTASSGGDEWGTGSGSSGGGGSTGGGGAGGGGAGGGAGGPHPKPFSVLPGGGGTALAESGPDVAPQGGTLGRKSSVNHPYGGLRSYLYSGGY